MTSAPGSPGSGGAARLDITGGPSYILPFIVPSTALATQVLVYGLVALGFNLLYG